MDALGLMYRDFSDSDDTVTSLPEVVCNLTLHFRCHDGLCVNATVLCDGYIDCVDGTDEDGCFAPVKRKLSPLEVAAIVLGCIIGTVIVCCLLGTIIDCFMHVYKYWCSCLHKAYNCPSEMIALRPQGASPRDPTVLVVRAIPPSYSTILVSCEPSSQVARAQNSGSEDSPSTATTIISASDLFPAPLSPVRPPAQPGEGQQDTATNTDGPATTRDMSTQTSGASRESLALQTAAYAQTTASTNLLGTNSRSMSSLMRMRLPPSYSSIFRQNECVGTSSRSDSQSQLVFQNLRTDQSNCSLRGTLGSGHTQTTSVEVHALRTPEEAGDGTDPRRTQAGSLLPQTGLLNTASKGLH